MFKSSSALSYLAGVVLLRWTVAGLMLLHGVSKLRGGVGGIEAMLSNAGLPGWFAYGVFVGEVVAPLLVMAGILVRPAALVMALNMVVAIALVHRDELFVLGRTGGYALELQALFLLGSIAIALIGGRSRG